MAFRWLFLVFLIAPQFATANYSLPLTGTTTTGSIYAFPASVNGIQPALMSPWFLATSTSRASLFPFASTTAISAVSVCLTGDICRQTWPTGNAPGGTAGQLQYNASGSFGGISTTTLTISGFPAQIPSGYGKLVGGADTTFTWWGLATSTAITTNQVLYSTSASGVSSAATSSLTASGVLTLSNPAAIIGSSGAALTVTGGTNGQVLGWSAGVPAWVATSTNSCSGVTCAYNSGTWTFSIANNAITTGMLATLAANSVLGNNTGATGNVVAVATSTFFGVDYPINSSGKTGIGSSSPWALFSINPVQQIGSAPSFAIGSSSGQVLNVDNTGALNLFTNNATSTFNDKYGTTLMSLHTGSTTGPIFSVNATTSTPALPVNLFTVDQYGHLMASSTPNTPTVSCSPSGGTLAANSNDTTGAITTGTLSTSCAVTFSRAYSQTPLVFVTQSGTASIFGVSSRSTTAFTVTLGTAATGDVLQYFVIMP